MGGGLCRSFPLWQLPALENSPPPLRRGTGRPGSGAPPSSPLKGWGRPARVPGRTSFRRSWRVPVALSLLLPRPPETKKEHWPTSSRNPERDARAVEGEPLIDCRRSGLRPALIGFIITLQY